MRRIGLEPGQSFDIDQADPAAKQALETVPQDAQKLMQWKLTGDEAKTLVGVVPLHRPNLLT